MKALLQAKSNYYLWKPTIQTSLGLDVWAEENEAFDSVGPNYLSYHSSSYHLSLLLKRTFLYAIVKLIKKNSCLLNS